ncbi:hypothetical protein SAMN05421640_2883 [Ekhidna lutea]|uniref:Polyketide cyclase / dehydrase and lipid transport n=1 Tax=Ekhidna lutea TaxID=447679 RepID=A0A239L0I0_EKHLU|nr:hypothetical protein [Ekhidna lutea]SNT23961.1 hypothetical protein SAMN05421640_2883 [Ekhidna lutea]
MLSITNSISIKKPLSEVFAFVSDQRNNPKWNYNIVNVKKTNEAEGVGAEYLQIRKSDKQPLASVRVPTNRKIN